MSEKCKIRCPECGDTFNSTIDKEGKKIRCPECDEPFKVTAKMITMPKGPRESGIQKGTKPTPAADPGKNGDQEKAKTPPAAAPPAPAPKKDSDEDEDEGENPYTMVEVHVAPRCPSCANELLSAKDIICVYCGYNTMTREVGQTKKTIELTAQDQLVHLAPALGALTFAFFLFIALLYFSILFPYLCRDNWMWIFDTEPVRLFFTVMALLLLYSAGNFGLNQVIFHPKPREREKG